MNGYNLKPATSALRAHPQAGFTLVELLVVMGIVIIVSSVILANNSRFGGNVLLENLAYDIALSVRQAQIYGIAVRSFSAGNFSAGYGMHFDVSNPTTYVLFADAVVPNGLYDEGELVQSTDIGRGYFIAKLCEPAGSDIDSCTSVSKLDILFKRPEPDAYIRANSGSDINESARIVVQSPRDNRMSIVVEATGQISVQ